MRITELWARRLLKELGTPQSNPSQPQAAEDNGMPQTPEDPSADPLSGQQPGEMGPDGALPDINPPMQGSDPNAPMPGMPAAPGSAPAPGVSGSAFGQDGAAPQEAPKPVDPTLVTAVRGMDFTTGYKHDPTSAVSPDRVMSMGDQDLHQLRSIAKAKMQAIEVKDRVGLYANQSYKYYKDLLAFAQAVSDHREKAKRASEV
jgi:hypothetical protein